MYHYVGHSGPIWSKTHLSKIELGETGKENVDGFDIVHGYRNDHARPFIVDYHPVTLTNLV